MTKKQANPVVKFLQQNLVLIGIVILIIVTAIVNPKFLGAANLTNVMRQLGALPFVAELNGDGSVEPVSAASLQGLADCRGASDEEIDQALQGVLAQVAPLSGSSGRELRRFVSACAALMEGGLPVACDWAILLWVLPAMDRSARAVAAMRPLLEEYPLSLARLQA